MCTLVFEGKLLSVHFPSSCSKFIHCPLNNNKHQYINCGSSQLNIQMLPSLKRMFSSVRGLCNCYMQFNCIWIGHQRKINTQNGLCFTTINAVSIVLASLNSKVARMNVQDNYGRTNNRQLRCCLRIMSQRCQTLAL